MLWFWTAGLDLWLRMATIVCLGDRAPCSALRYNSPPCRHLSRKVQPRCSVDIIETIKEQIANNTILLYMKGSPNAPQCGFSAKAAQAVMGCGEKFAYVDILQNPEIRANLPKYANWPTFPQLWVAGELVGGSDIMAEMAADGSLQTLIKEAAAKAAANKAEA